MKIAIPIAIARHWPCHDALAAKSEIAKGQYLIEGPDYVAILKAQPKPIFAPRVPAVNAPRLRGLGDVFHIFALPIARFFRLPCIDPRTGKLRPDSPCARRQAHWNTKSARFMRWSRALLNRLIPFRATPPR